MMVDFTYNPSRRKNYQCEKSKTITTIFGFVVLKSNY